MNFGLFPAFNSIRNFCFFCTCNF